MRGYKIELKMLGSKSKKQFTEWDEAIFLAAFQVFEDAVTQEPNIISRFRYKVEQNLAIKLKYVQTQKELADKVKKARELLKWWLKYKKRYIGEIRSQVMGESTQQDKLKELADILPILWD